MSIASCAEGCRHGLRASGQWQSLRLSSLKKQWSLSILHPRTLHTETPRANDVPFRKLLKDEAKKRREPKRGGAYEEVKPKTLQNGEAAERLKRWDLTVGIEVHAQLNTERKLFSASKTSVDDEPNTNVSVFDLAFPGSQPELQTATLLPAIRAAIALNCQIQPRSKFDRKHYFYQDQPAGYQITQYYEPFAINGHLDLSQHDGINLPVGQPIHIGVKQVQLEQDTAKSNLHPPSTALLDFNRVGHPLIEIITLPEIHSAQAAAACVRKIQSILKAVNAVTTGMENGGLRADVNVSVSPKGSRELGQRTEIKNLSSFKAVEDAVVAERDRQIDVLESGGSIQGETRGWTLGSIKTTKLRGKEGEVDYRYMPDPDILPLIIGRDLVDRISVTLPPLPDALVKDLVEKSGLSEKDARTLVFLDDGDRLDYFDEVRAALSDLNASFSVGQKSTSHDTDKTVANWVIHELGGLLSTASNPFTPTVIPPHSLASIISHLHSSLITGTTAKRLLAMVFNGDTRDINTIIDKEELTVKHVSLTEYQTIAQGLLDENVEKVEQIRKGQLGKVKWFVGQMMRRGQGKIDAVKAEMVLRELLGLAEINK